MNSLLTAKAYFSAIAKITLSVFLLCALNIHANAASKILVFCSEASPSGFDPGPYVAGTDFDASAATIYSRLVEFKRGSTEIEPGLAQRWEISADHLQYTFYLRRGVKFHSTEWFKPTRDFNADDVIFTFERMLNKNHPFRKAYPVEFPYFVDVGMEKGIRKIEKIDPYTVRFTLNTVSAPFMRNIAMKFLSILSAEYANALLKAGKAREINTKPIGTGPFIFRNYRKDAVIRYDAHPVYWNKNEVRVDHLIFAITPDPSVRMQKLKKNECQITLNPRPADVSVLKKDKNIKMPNQPGLNLGYIAYNVARQPLNKLEVRQALDMTVNKKAIVDSVYQGIAQLAENALPPTQWSYSPEIKDAPFDLNKAKQLLLKAGYPNGFEITLWAMPVQRPYLPNAKLAAEMIQADWAKIGVRAKIVTYEWGEYIKRAHSGEHDALLIGWTSDNGDPDNWLGVLLGCEAIDGNNFSKWCNPEFEKLIQAARKATDETERTRLYQQAQIIFKREIPFTPIAHSIIYQPMRLNVLDFKISPFGMNEFYGVGLSEKK